MMIGLVIVIFVSTSVVALTDSSYWNWLESKISEIEFRINDIERQLQGKNIDSLNIRIGLLNIAMGILEDDEGIVNGEINVLKERIGKVGTKSITWEDSQNRWDEWDRINGELNKTERKKYKLESILNKIESLKIAIKHQLKALKKEEERKKRVEKILKKKISPFIGIGMMIIREEKENKNEGTRTYFSRFCGEIGVKISLPKEGTTLNFFLGSYGKEKEKEYKKYEGISVLLPVVSPEEGKLYGSWSWIEIGITSYPTVLLGLSLESGKNWKIQLRTFFGGKEEIPAFQAGIAKTF